MDYYTENAQALFEQYQSLETEQVHDAWLSYLPKTAGLALDVGAGSGRDASWLASMGWDVVAVEPCDALRRLGEASTPASVSWLNDTLPDLKTLRLYDYKFDLILLSAVWMHIPEPKRERAFRVLSEMLNPGGVIVISLRHSDSQHENNSRQFHSVSVDEISQLAKQRVIGVLSVVQQPDKLRRQGVFWETVVLQLPDDGTGSLPLLRHIIVNDNKSSSYKLGLLRSLIRVAEGAPGLVMSRGDDFVDLPFGLIGLYWLKLYMPLVLQHKLMQGPSHKPEMQEGLGFAKKDYFYALNTFSSFDLRVGATFSPERAKILIGAIRDACANIQSMPVKFITYPGSYKPIFECSKKSVRSNNKYWQINQQTLSEFGVFRVPTKLWSSLSQYACWIEPAIVNEWSQLMIGYELRYDTDVYHRALLWEEGKRDTSQARQQVSRIQAAGEQVNCVWSASKITETYQMDHCFPWSRWGNNDLWNLMPATQKINSNKSEKLPSAKIMHDSKMRILQWWEAAYENSDLSEKFTLEAQAAISGLQDGFNLNALFEGVMHQRSRLKRNQQLVEWE